MQVASDLFDAVGVRALEGVIRQVVIRNHVHDCVLALEQANDAVHFLLVVIDAF
ncbi:hypothetical protein D3C77_715120 [compost metagenome]